MISSILSNFWPTRYFKFILQGVKLMRTYKESLRTCNRTTRRFSQNLEQIRRDVSPPSDASEDSSDDGMGSDVIDQPCAVCGSPDDVASCLLCDSCDIAVHFRCVRLDSVPAGDWSCPWCWQKTVPSSKEVRISKKLSRKHLCFMNLKYIGH